MRKWVSIPLLLVSLFLCAAQDKRKQKGMELEILEIHVQRAEGQVHLDGKVKNIGDAAVKSAQMIFYFVAPDKQIVSTRRGELESDEVDPGEEAEFRLEMPFPARAAFVRVEAEDKRERFINIVNNGPFAID